MQITFNHGGRIYQSWEPEAALARGVPTLTVNTALKGGALKAIEQATDALREQLAPRRPAKLIEYRIKAELAEAYAADPTSIAAEVTTELTREATAAGMTLAELMTMIAVKSAAYDRAITTVAALEAECEARILAVDLAAPDYQQQLAVVAATNTGEIETARTSVSALIEGV